MANYSCSRELRKIPGGHGGEGHCVLFLKKVVDKNRNRCLAFSGKFVLFFCDYPEAELRRNPWPLIHQATQRRQWKATERRPVKRRQRSCHCSGKRPTPRAGFSQYFVFSRYCHPHPTTSPPKGGAGTTRDVPRSSHRAAPGATGRCKLLAARGGKALKHLFRKAPE